MPGAWGGKSLAGSQKFRQAVRGWDKQKRTVADETREGRCPGPKGTEDHAENCELGLLGGLDLISRRIGTETERAPEKSPPLPAEDAGDVESGETQPVSRPFLKDRYAFPTLQFG